jgi:hypothetical protein
MYLIHVIKFRPFLNIFDFPYSTNLRKIEQEWM